MKWKKMPNEKLGRTLQCIIFKGLISEYKASKRRENNLKDSTEKWATEMNT